MIARLARLFLGKPADPLAFVDGVIDALVQSATERRDMKTVGRLESARSAIKHAALAGGR